MTKKFQLYLHNNSGNPLKIPFKRGTPRELQARVDGIIKVGKKAIIPSDISEFVDMDIIRNYGSRVKYKIREVSAIPSKTKPVKRAKKVAKPKEKVKVEKKNEKKEVINA